MSFIKYVTLILLGLGPSYGDKESWGERSARMEVIATAIDDAAAQATCSDKYATSSCEKLWPKDKKSLALLLVTKGFFESRFAKNVHEGHCLDYECDSYKGSDGSIRHRARSPWQIQRTGLVNAEEYALMNSATLESTTMSAVVATRYLSNGMKACKTIHGAMAIYGGATSCTWPGVNARESFYKTLFAKTDEQLAAAAEDQKVRLESRFKSQVNDDKK